MLWKAFKDKMTQAFWYITNAFHKNSLSSKQYEKLRNDFSTHHSSIMKGYDFGKEFSNKMRQVSFIREQNKTEEQKIDFSNKIKQHWKENREFILEKIKNRNYSNLKNIPHKNQTKEMRGRIWMHKNDHYTMIKPELYDEYIKNGYIKGKKFKITECPYCKKFIDNGNYQRHINKHLGIKSKIKPMSEETKLKISKSKKQYWSDKKSIILQEGYL
jgi:hypothetical protein